MFIVTKEIDSENISKLCRTCLREDGDKMVCLFVGPAGSSLAAKLRSLSCLEVWQGDGLPEKMCDRCVTRAESALLYREQCRAADRALRQAVLKVSRLSSYAMVSGCKLYQPDQSFAPVQNSHKSVKCMECDAVFASNQELGAHSRLHMPFAHDDIPMQHMHIVEAQNPYINLNFGQPSPINLNNENVHQTDLSALARSNAVQLISSVGENPTRAACALHCSLCNRTFTNRTQLISHNISHSTENTDACCETENIDICGNSNQIPQNLSYERPMSSVGNSIRSSSYQRAPPTTGTNNEMQNLSFPEGIDLGVAEEEEEEEEEEVEEGEGAEEEEEEDDDEEEEVVEEEEEEVEGDRIHRGENIVIQDSETYTTTSCRVERRFAKVLERVETEGNRNGYQSCSSNFGYNKQQIPHEHPENVESLKKYKCESCPKFFSQKSKLTTHRLSHSGQQPFKCSSCEKAYSSKSKLNAHKRLHTKTNVHPCKMCDKIFAYPSYLREHLKSHKPNGRGDNASIEEVKPFECISCKKQFRLLKNLRAHERFHTGKGLFQCEICDKRFSQNYNLKIHLRTHKASKPHACEYCNKCFTQKGNLAEHLRIHTKVKPFECKDCGKRFSQSSHLKNHEASHATYRKYQCRLCGKRFKLTNHLKRHLILHSGPKSYKCHQCDQLFSQAFSLARHLKRHEPPT